MLAQNTSILKTSILFFLLLFCNVCLLSQQEQRVLENYNQLHVAGNIEIILVNNGTTTADVTIIDGKNTELITSVKNSTLNVSFDNTNETNWNGGSKAKIILGYKEISCIKTSASAKVKMKDDLIKSNEIDIIANSGSLLVLSLDTDRCELNTSSGANVTLSGSTKDFTVSSSSGSIVQADKFMAQIVKANASSGSSLLVNAINSFEAEASSGSNIQYLGDPSIKKIESGQWSNGNISKR